MSLPVVPCKGVGCSAKIGWIRTKRGKMAPVDPEPVQAHMVLGAASGLGTRISLTTEDGETFSGERFEQRGPRTVLVRGYVSHYATCPAHTQFRKGVRRPSAPAV